MTDLERQVINAVATSDYNWGSGAVGEGLIGNPVWAFSVADGIRGTKASRGGAIASCSVKGWISFSSNDKKDDCISLTREGYDAYLAEGFTFPK